MGNESPLVEMHLVGIIHGDDDKSSVRERHCSGDKRLIGRIGMEPFPEGLNGSEVGKPSAHSSLNIRLNSYLYNHENFS